MARIISQELDPNDKLDNLLAGDNVENKRQKLDGTVEDVKRDSIMEDAYSAVIKNENFQKEAAAIYKAEGGRYFDKTGPGSLDDLFDKYLKQTELYKDLEVQKKTELDLLVLSTGLSLSQLLVDVRKDLDNIDLTNSDLDVFKTIQEIANKKVVNTNNTTSGQRNGIVNPGGA